MDHGVRSLQADLQFFQNFSRSLQAQLSLVKIANIIHELLAHFSPQEHKIKVSRGESSKLWDDPEHHYPICNPLEQHIRTPYALVAYNTSRFQQWRLRPE